MHQTLCINDVMHRGEILFNEFLGHRGEGVRQKMTHEDRGRGK